jgi:hypothetical protein
MSNNPKIKARIKVLETILKKPGNTLGKEAGLGNGTVDGWTDSQLDKPNAVVEKFLRHYNIDPAWWKTGEGEIFITSVDKSTDYKEKAADPREIYRTIVEGKTEYVLIARTVLQDRYRLVAVETVNSDKNTIDKLLDQNNKQKTTIDKILDQNDKLIDLMNRFTQPQPVANVVATQKTK